MHEHQNSREFYSCGRDWSDQHWKDQQNFVEPCQQRWPSSNSNNIGQAQSFTKYSNWGRDFHRNRQNNSHRVSSIKLLYHNQHGGYTSVMSRSSKPQNSYGIKSHKYYRKDRHTPQRIESKQSMDVRYRERESGSSFGHIRPRDSLTKNKSGKSQSISTGKNEISKQSRKDPKQRKPHSTEKTEKTQLCEQHNISEIALPDTPNYENNASSTTSRVKGFSNVDVCKDGSKISEENDICTPNDESMNKVKNKNFPLRERKMKKVCSSDKTKSHLAISQKIYTKYKDIFLREPVICLTRINEDIVKMNQSLITNKNTDCESTDSLSKSGYERTDTLANWLARSKNPVLREKIDTQLEVMSSTETDKTETKQTISNSIESKQMENSQNSQQCVVDKNKQNSSGGDVGLVDPKVMLLSKPLQEAAKKSGQLFHKDNEVMKKPVSKHSTSEVIPTSTVPPCVLKCSHKESGISWERLPEDHVKLTATLKKKQNDIIFSSLNKCFEKKSGSKLSSNVSWKFSLDKAVIENKNVVHTGTSVSQSSGCVSGLQTGAASNKNQTRECKLCHISGTICTHMSGDDQSSTQVIQSDSDRKDKSNLSVFERIQPVAYTNASKVTSTSTISQSSTNQNSLITKQSNVHSTRVTQNVRGVQSNSQGRQTDKLDTKLTWHNLHSFFQKLNGDQIDSFKKDFPKNSWHKPELEKPICDKENNIEHGMQFTESTSETDHVSGEVIKSGSSIASKVCDSGLHSESGEKNCSAFMAEKVFGVSKETVPNSNKFTSGQSTITSSCVSTSVSCLGSDEKKRTSKQVSREKISSVNLLNDTTDSMHSKDVSSEMQCISSEPHSVMSNNDISPNELQNLIESTDTVDNTSHTQYNTEKMSSDKTNEHVLPIDLGNSAVSKPKCGVTSHAGANKNDLSGNQFASAPPESMQVVRPIAIRDQKINNVCGMKIVEKQSYSPNLSCPASKTLKTIEFEGCEEFKKKNNESNIFSCPARQADRIGIVKPSSINNTPLISKHLSEKSNISENSVPCVPQITISDPSVSKKTTETNLIGEKAAVKNPEPVEPCSDVRNIKICHPLVSESDSSVKHGVSEKSPHLQNEKVSQLNRNGSVTNAGIIDVQQQVEPISVSYVEFSGEKENVSTESNAMVGCESKQKLLTKQQGVESQKIDSTSSDMCLISVTESCESVITPGSIYIDRAIDICGINEDRKGVFEKNVKNKATVDVEAFIQNSHDSMLQPDEDVITIVSEQNNHTSMLQSAGDGVEDYDFQISDNDEPLCIITSVESEAMKYFGDGVNEHPHLVIDTDQISNESSDRESSQLLSSPDMPPLEREQDISMSDKNSLNGCSGDSDIFFGDAPNLEEQLDIDKYSQCQTKTNSTNVKLLNDEVWKIVSEDKTVDQNENAGCTSSSENSGRSNGLQTNTDKNQTQGCKLCHESVIICTHVADFNENPQHNVLPNEPGPLDISKMSAIKHVQDMSKLSHMHDVKLVSNGNESSFHPSNKTNSGEECVTDFSSGALNSISKDVSVDLNIKGPTFDSSISQSGLDSQKTMKKQTCTEMCSDENQMASDISDSLYKSLSKKDSLEVTEGVSVTMSPRDICLSNVNSHHEHISGSETMLKNDSSFEEDGSAYWEKTQRLNLEKSEKNAMPFSDKLKLESFSQHQHGNKHDIPSSYLNTGSETANNIIPSSLPLDLNSQTGDNNEDMVSAGEEESDDEPALVIDLTFKNKEPKYIGSDVISQSGDVPKSNERCVLKQENSFTKDVDNSPKILESTEMVTKMVDMNSNSNDESLSSTEVYKDQKLSRKQSTFSSKRRDEYRKNVIDIIAKKLEEDSMASAIATTPSNAYSDLRVMSEPNFIDSCQMDDIQSSKEKCNSENVIKDSVMENNSNHSFTQSVALQNSADVSQMNNSLFQTDQVECSIDETVWKDEIQDSPINVLETKDRLGKLITNLKNDIELRKKGKVLPGVTLQKVKRKRRRFLGMRKKRRISTKELLQSLAGDSWEFESINCDKTGSASEDSELEKENLVMEFVDSVNTESDFENDHSSVRNDENKTKMSRNEQILQVAKKISRISTPKNSILDSDDDKESDKINNETDNSCEVKAEHCSQIKHEKENGNTSTKRLKKKGRKVQRIHAIKKEEGDENTVSETDGNDQMNQMNTDSDDLPTIHPPKRRKHEKGSFGKISKFKDMESENCVHRIMQEFPRHNWLEQKINNLAKSSDDQSSEKSLDSVGSPAVLDLENQPSVAENTLSHGLLDPGNAEHEVKTESDNIPDGAEDEEENVEQKPNIDQQAVADIKKQESNKEVKNKNGSSFPEVDNETTCDMVSNLKVEPDLESTSDTTILLEGDKEEDNFETLDLSVQTKINESSDGTVSKWIKVEDDEVEMESTNSETVEDMATDVSVVGTDLDNRSISEATESVMEEESHPEESIENDSAYTKDAQPLDLCTNFCDNHSFKTQRTNNNPPVQMVHPHVHRPPSPVPPTTDADNGQPPSLIQQTKELVTGGLVITEDQSAKAKNGKESLEHISTIDSSQVFAYQNDLLTSIEVPASLAEQIGDKVTLVPLPPSSTHLPQTAHTYVSAVVASNTLSMPVNLVSTRVPKSAEHPEARTQVVHLGNTSTSPSRCTVSANQVVIVDGRGSLNVVTQSGSSLQSSSVSLRKILPKPDLGRRSHEHTEEGPVEKTAKETESLNSQHGIANDGSIQSVCHSSTSLNSSCDDSKTQFGQSDDLSSSLNSSFRATNTELEKSSGRHDFSENSAKDDTAVGLNLVCSKNNRNVKEHVSSANNYDKQLMDFKRLEELTLRKEKELVTLNRIKSRMFSFLEKQNVSQSHLTTSTSQVTSISSVSVQPVYTQANTQSQMQTTNSYNMAQVVDFSKNSSGSDSELMSNVTRDKPCPAHQASITVNQMLVKRLKAIVPPPSVQNSCPYIRRKSAIHEPPLGKSNIFEGYEPAKAHSQPPFHIAGSLIVPVSSAMKKRRRPKISQFFVNSNNQGNNNGIQNPSQPSFQSPEEYVSDTSKAVYDNSLMENSAQNLVRDSEHHSVRTNYNNSNPVYRGQSMLISGPCRDIQSNNDTSDSFVVNQSNHRFIQESSGRMCNNNDLSMAAAKDLTRRPNYSETNVVRKDSLDARKQNLTQKNSPDIIDLTASTPTNSSSGSCVEIGTENSVQKELKNALKHRQQTFQSPSQRGVTHQTMQSDSHQKLAVQNFQNIARACNAVSCDPQVPYPQRNKNFRYKNQQDSFPPPPSVYGQRPTVFRNTNTRFIPYGPRPSMPCSAQQSTEIELTKNNSRPYYYPGMVGANTNDAMNAQNHFTSGHHNVHVNQEPNISPNTDYHNSYDAPGSRQSNFPLLNSGITSQSSAQVSPKYSPSQVMGVSQSPNMTVSPNGIHTYHHQSTGNYVNNKTTNYRGPAPQFNPSFSSQNRESNVHATCELMTPTTYPGPKYNTNMSNTYMQNPHFPSPAKMRYQNPPAVYTTIAPRLSTNNKMTAPLPADISQTSPSNHSYHSPGSSPQMMEPMAKRVMIPAVSRYPSPIQQQSSSRYSSPIQQSSLIPRLLQNTQVRPTVPRQPNPLRNIPNLTQVKKSCAVCGKTAPYFCAQCRKLWYCSTECQIKEERLRNVFSVYGHLTDCSLKYTQSGHFRKFAFIGFKSPKEAEAAEKQLNGTFIDTSRIQIAFAKDFGDTTKPRAWSKYSTESSRFKSNTPQVEKAENESEKLSKKQKKEKKKNEKVMEMIGELKDDPEFSEFLTAHKASSTKMAWSDDVVGVKQDEKIKRDDVYFEDDNNSESEDESNAEKNDEITNTKIKIEKNKTALKKHLSDLDK